MEATAMKTRVVRVPKSIAVKYLDRERKIAACEGVYTLRDVAKFFGGVSHEHVRAIWARKLDTSDIEPPNIYGTSRQPALREDLLILCGRGLTVREAAMTLNVSHDHALSVLRETPRGREALERNRETLELLRAGRNDLRESFGPSYRIDYPNAN
jgi:hypothetical protein